MNIFYAEHVSVGVTFVHSVLVTANTGETSAAVVYKDKNSANFSIGIKRFFHFFAVTEEVNQTFFGAHVGAIFLRIRICRYGKGIVCIPIFIFFVVKITSDFTVVKNLIKFSLIAQFYSGI